MFRLRDLITEQKNPKKLLKLVNKEYQIPERPIVRGSDRSIDTYKELSIRKDREPRDTDYTTDHIVDAIEDGFYSQYPKRSESKFAASWNKTDFVSGFGDHVYYCFPHKNAQLASLKHDAVDYLKDTPDVYSWKILIDDIQDLNCYLKFLYFLHLYKKTGTDDLEEFENNLDKLKSFVKNNWDCIYKKSQISYRNADLGGIEVARENNFAGYYSVTSHFVRKVQGYFDDLTLDRIYGSSEEVIFDGPKYIMVDKKYFEENFKFELSRNPGETGEIKMR